MMDEAVMTTFIVALFSMMNPVGNVGIFASMTEDRSDSEARQIAWKCALACGVTLLIVIWGGGGLLKLFGIGVDQLKTGGGIIVLIIGLHMLFNKSEHKMSSQEAEETRESIAIVPLAIPLVAGPGTMATVLVMSEHHAQILSKIDISLATMGLCCLTGALFAYSRGVARWLGQSGMAVVTRVMGMILVAIATGMVAEGIMGMVSHASG